MSLLTGFVDMKWVLVITWVMATGDVPVVRQDTSTWPSIDQCLQIGLAVSQGLEVTLKPISISYTCDLVE